MTVTTPTLSASNSPGRDTLSPNTRPARASDDPGIVAAVSSIILDLAERNGTVTADDVRDAAPGIPFKRSVLGAAFRQLKQQSLIVADGRRPSRVKANHGRSIQVYRLHRVKACLGPTIPPSVSA